MPLVFISYNRKDGKYAKALSDQMKARGIAVFLDVDSIAPSQQFPKATADSIAKCDLLLLLWSHNSAASHFVTDEWNIALACKKAIFPVLLDNCPLPAALTAINAWQWSSAVKLANRVVGLVMPGEGNSAAIKADHAPKNGRRVWIMGIVIVILLTGIIALLPAALTWQAQIGPVIFPPDPISKGPDSLPTPPPRKDTVIPKPKKILLSGEIFDDRSGTKLQGVKACAVAYDSEGQTISSPPCVTTNSFGHYEIEFTAGNVQNIDVAIDGSAIGYASRIIPMDPKSDMRKRQLLLRRI